MALVVGLLLHFLLFLVALHYSLNLGYHSRRGQCTGKVNAKISRWNRNKKQPNHNWGRQEQQRQQWMWPMKIYTNCVFLILFHKASTTALLYDQTLIEYPIFLINDIIDKPAPTKFIIHPIRYIDPGLFGPLTILSTSWIPCWKILSTDRIDWIFLHSHFRGQ